jgi:hypothetical protein
VDGGKAAAEGGGDGRKNTGRENAEQLGRQKSKRGLLIRLLIIVHIFCLTVCNHSALQRWGGGGLGVGAVLNLSMSVRIRPRRFGSATLTHRHECL